MGWSELTETTALVTGASRGFGRGIAAAASGSTVVTMSSGAALFGSPLSGRYAGAKATALGAVAVAAYARRAGTDLDEFVKRSGPALVPEQVGKHIVDLASAADQSPGAYLLTPDGMKEISS